MVWVAVLLSNAGLVGFGVYTTPELAQSATIELLQEPVVWEPILFDGGALESLNYTSRGISRIYPVEPNEPLLDLE